MPLLLRPYPFALTPLFRYFIFTYPAVPLFLFRYALTLLRRYFYLLRTYPAGMRRAYVTGSIGLQTSLHTCRYQMYVCR